MILITGASSGIGESCARAFAKQGHNLFLVARRKDRLEALAKAITAENGVAVTIEGLDISDRAAVETFAVVHSGSLSKITVLINNAGLAKGMGLIQEGQLADWDTMLDTNVKGLLYMTHAVLPYFQKNGEGHIVNLGSVAGHWVYPKGNIYCATKAAVHSLTQSLRLDLNGSLIRVTEISPGMVETDFSRVRFGNEERAKAVYAGMVPLTGDDVAEAVVWSVNRPKHVNIQEIVLYPTDQASPAVVHRRPEK